jgi:bifunctional DNA-binding transcriptional regulator/antitoxin component of YhaV-PrlF toxin-antitoxin module
MQMSKKKTYSKPIQVTKTGRARIELPIEIKKELNLKNKEKACIEAIGSDKILIKLQRENKQYEGKNSD